MIRAIARNALWLFAFGLALALLTPWHAAAAAPNSPAYFSPHGGSHHRTDCTLFASRMEAAPAQARKAAASAPPETAADSALRDRANFTADSAARPHPASRVVQGSFLPLYLVNLRLLR